MAVFKGAQLRVTGGEVIIGDDVITPYVPDEPEALERTVPAEGAAETGAVGADWELDGNLDDLFAEQSVPEAAPAAPDWEAPIREYEQLRDQVIFAANDDADNDANHFGEQVQAAAGDLMTATIEQAQADLLEANPNGDFAQVSPYVQRRVAVELDLELVGMVNEIRWTHLQRAEGRITESVFDVASEIEQRHSPETFAELMAERESIVSEARLEAERVLMEAMTRSAETMAQAERVQAQTMAELEGERERILKELREQAWQEGFEEGKSEGSAEAATYVQEALQKLNEIAIAFPAAVKQNEEKLVTLALEIASKVIQEEIALQPEIVQRTVETALRRVSDLEQVTVKVNPLDLDLILPKQETFKMLMPDVQNFSIEGSHTIQRGGCLIETNSGSINATINAQLSIVDEIFRNVRAEYEDELMGEIS